MKIQTSLVLLISLLSLGACADTTPRLATDYVATPKRYAKPGANIDLEKTQVNLETSGVDYAIDIRLSNAYGGATVSLDMRASDGLFITGGDVSPSQNLARGVTSFPLTVNATAPGRYYIYINAKVEKGELVTGRALTFIVQVGGAVDESGLQNSRSEEAGVHIMPATEDVFR